MARFFQPQKKTLDTKHKVMTVVRLDHHGDGVALEGKKPIFVSGVLPGEEILVQLTEDKRQYGRAKLIKIIQPSAERIAPFCPHYRVCGGCNLQHSSHAAQISAKQSVLTQLMKKFAQAELTQDAPVISPETGYRCRARLSVKVAKNGELAMGFRQRNSNEIVTITHCPVLVLRLDNVLPAIYELVNSLRGRRIIGHIELVDSHTGCVLLVRAIKNLHQDDVAALTAFAKEHQLHLYLQQQDLPPQRCVGEIPAYVIDNLTMTFEPQDFIQVNTTINQKMIAQALQWLAVENKDEVLDLFCGLGNFSLPLALQAHSVVGIEGVESMVARATENARINKLDNVHFYHANLELDPRQTAWGKRDYDKILLDPSRAGAFEVMRHVAQSTAKRVVYVSCNPVTLARDTQILLDGGYKLAKLGMLDMFPHTGHLESMALFVKN